jgi:hypothetical protein
MACAFGPDERHGDAVLKRQRPRDPVAGLADAVGVYSLGVHLRPFHREADDGRGGGRRRPGAAAAPPPSSPGTDGY